MEHTTGLTDDEFDELLVRLRDAGVEGNPSIPGPFGSLQATPVHLRNACGACISSPPSGRSSVPLSAHIPRPIARAGR